MMHGQEAGKGNKKGAANDERVQEITRKVAIAFVFVAVFYFFIKLLFL